jgi:hypothetical protein
MKYWEWLLIRELVNAIFKQDPKASISLTEWTNYHSIEIRIPREKKKK